MSGAARHLRALPRTPEPASDDAIHAACILEQARRAERLKRLIAEHEAEREQLIREYEQLADRYNEARAELARWRSWAADLPTRGRDHAED